MDTRAGPKRTPASWATSSRNRIGPRTAGPPGGRGAGEQLSWGPPARATSSDTPSWVSGGAPAGRRGRAGPYAGTGELRGGRKRWGRNQAGARSILPAPAPGAPAPGSSCDPSALARTFAGGEGLAVQAKADGVGLPALAPSRAAGQPGSLALTYPSWPSGWCPTAPTLFPAAASGRSAGRTALPGRWAVRRSRGAPRAPVAPCRPLLRD